MNTKDKKMTLEELLSLMEVEFGQEPETMVLLSKIDEKAVFEHANNKNFVFGRETIPPKYKLLMSLAISAALGVEHCIETYTTVALKNGLSKEEIIDAILLARFVKGTTVLSSSTSSFKIMEKHFS